MQEVMYIYLFISKYAVRFIYITKNQLQKRTNYIIGSEKQERFIIKLKYNFES